jgi:hypothetical protein
MTLRRSRWFICLGFVAVLLMAAFEVPSASSRIVWRLLVLSFDSPATQSCDELACQSSQTSEPDETDRYTRLVTPPAGRLAAVARRPHRAPVTLSPGITRAPPSV